MRKNGLYIYHVITLVTALLVCDITDYSVREEGLQRDVVYLC
jgi:hypothetical protein